MSRIVGVALLLIILLDLFDSTASTHRPHVPEAQGPKCKCRPTTKDRIKCPPRFFPRTDEEKRDVMKCLCSKHEFLKERCKLWVHRFPISLA